MRKTKIICTIGPSSDNEEVLTQLCTAGMDVARINFSHGTHEEHQKKIDLIKSVRERIFHPKKAFALYGKAIKINQMNPILKCWDSRMTAGKSGKNIIYSGRFCVILRVND